MKMKKDDFKPTKKACELAKSLNMEIIVTKESEEDYDLLSIFRDESNMLNPEKNTVDDCIAYKIVGKKLLFDYEYQMFNRLDYSLVEELPLWIINNHELKQLIRFIAENN